MTENIYYVYQLRIENDEQPFYIGMGQNDRLNDHFNEETKWDGVRRKKINAYKLRKIRKAKNNGLKVFAEKIYENLDADTAIRLEIETIKIYGRHDLKEGPLTNKTNGGEGVRGYVFTDEDRERISNQMKGNKYNLGRKPSEETRRLLSEQRLGNQYTKDRILPKEEKEMLSRIHNIRFKNPEIMNKQLNIISKVHSMKNECEYCNKMVDIANYKLYHGDNCKLSPHYNPEDFKRIWVQRTGTTKRVIKKELQFYLDQGWILYDRHSKV